MKDNVAELKYCEKRNVLSLLSKEERVGRESSRVPDPREEAILCPMHSFVPVGFFTYLFMSDYLPGCLFAVVVL